MDFKKNDEAICAHLSDSKTQFLGAVVPPIFLNSLHVFESMEAKDALKDEYVYGRVANPTVVLAEEKIAAMEHAEEAAIFASGMGALTAAILHFVQAGDHVITLRNVYGPSKSFLTDYMDRFGIETSFVRGTSLEEFEQAIRPNTRLIYLESPLSMIFTLQDLRALSKLAKERGINTMIDNSWCSPIFQKPIDFGIDLVCHTISKYLGGHSDIIGGVVCGSHEAISSIKRRERELLGGIMGPMEASLLVRSLRTLPVRMKQHNETGLKVARWLENHPKVRRVSHPGLESHPQHELALTQMTGYAGVFGADLDATPEQTRAFVNALKVFQIGVSWGGFESLCLASSTNASDEDLEYFGTTRSWIRVVTGLEDADDLIADMDQAFRVAGIVE